MTYRQINTVFEEVPLLDVLDRAPGLAFFCQHELEEAKTAKRVARFLKGAWRVVIILLVVNDDEARSRVLEAISACPKLAKHDKKVLWLFDPCWSDDMAMEYSICCTLWGIKHWPPVHYPIERIDGPLPPSLFRLVDPGSFSD
jgi:hypothetical protein